MSTFTSARVRSGLVHFLLGKSLSSVAGFVGMVLVVRALAVEEFAAYSVLVALVEVVTALTGLGMSHVILRFVPELFGAGEYRALAGVVLRALWIRTVPLLLFAAGAWTFSEQFARLLALDAAVGALKVYIPLMVLRILAYFLSQTLESTLHQSYAQTAFTMTAVLRLAGVFILLHLGQAGLSSVILVEAMADGAGLLVMAVGCWVALRSDSGRLPGTWARTEWRRLGRFAAAGYLQHLAILPYGGHANRLAASQFLAAPAMAGYGFAQSLYDYCKRYMPAQLLVGLVRPVVVARYSETHRFSAAAAMCQKVLQINILLICFLLAPMLVSGTDVLLFISGGKYGSESLQLLVGMAVVLLLETQRQQLEMLSQTIERYDFLFWSNTLLSASILLALVLIPWAGALSLPVANLLGLIVANHIVSRALSGEGHQFKHDWLGTTLSILVLGVAAVSGLLFRRYVDNWIAAALVSVGVFAVLAGPSTVLRFKDFYRELTTGWRQRTALDVLIDADADTDVEATQPVIAFGLLSSKVESAAAIEQLAALLAPHPLYVHHDFNKAPGFVVRAPNVHCVPRIVNTAWGDWSLVEATLLVMEEALKNPKVTHFQLLSESCLPIKPVQEFEQYLARVRPDAMVDLVALSGHDVYRSHAWRYVSSAPFILKVLRKASSWTWGERVQGRQVAGINLQSARTDAMRWLSPRYLAGALIVGVSTLMMRYTVKRLGVGDLAVGSQWFGVSRRGAAWLLRCRDRMAPLADHFRRAHIPDEAFVQTLVMECARLDPDFRVCEGNHALFWNNHGTGPDVLGPDELQAAYAGARFFARKFSLDQSSALRSVALERASP